MVGTENALARRKDKYMTLQAYYWAYFMLLDPQP